MTPEEIQSHISALEQRSREVEAELANPDIFSQRSKFTMLSREKKRMDAIFSSFSEWKAALAGIQENTDLLESETDPEFKNLVKNDIEELENKAALKEKELMYALIPPDPADTKDTIIEIHPAAGGEEAALFAGDLFRMYTHFAERRGWKCETLELSETELGGIKDVIFSLAGEDVFSYMKYESGVHRVQRIPATETSGRIHTSTVTVSVLPEADELDEVVIRHEDLEISTFRASGAGGQYVNRTDSAVRMAHKPTGIVVSSQQERSQLRNREICLRILKAKIWEIARREEAAKQAEAKRSQVGTGDRSERIRTYNFPQSRVTDHRYGISAFDLPGLMEGNMEQVLDKIIAAEHDSAVKNLLSEISSSAK